MSSTTDRYRRRHGDTAYGYLAAQASMAGLESLAAELMRVAGAPVGRAADPTRVAVAGSLPPVGARTAAPGGARTAAPVGARTATPGVIAGRDTSGRALPVRAQHGRPAAR